MARTEETEMPIELTKRNGFICRNGLKVLRGGLGEFLIYSEDICIEVRLSYGSALAFTNGYAHGKLAK